MRASTLPLLLAAFAALPACDWSPYREVQVRFEPAAQAPVQQVAATASPRFRISVAGMESPSGTYAAYSQLFELIAQRLGYQLEFVQRRTYTEINQMLLKGELDAALLCTGGYLDLQRRDAESVELISVPIINGSDTYQSLIIVPATSSAQSIGDLEGQRFAFTDELSLTGRAWVAHELRKRHRTPDGYFDVITYTRNHDRSISAVARGVVDGASVHSIVFQHALESDPDLLRKVRVVQRSPEFGMTPLVASRRLPPATRLKLREVLLALAADPEGAALLEKVRINRFALAMPGLFDSAYDVVSPSP